MDFLQRENFKEILFKTSIASMAVYEANPSDYLINNASFNHGIEEICFSQSYGNELTYINKLHLIKYLIINDKENKRLYISFRGTQTLEDILNDVKIYSEINAIKGRFHNGFYKLAENVPVDYFIEKLVDEDYELIFTGHSLGAAIAAMITIKILYRDEMTKKYSDKITFIGYGCPSIADIYFQIENDQIYKNNFVFIKNENDIVVEILDYIAHLIYKPNDSDILNNLAGFFNKILQIITNKEVLNIQILEPLCIQFVVTAASSVAKLILPQYKQFGYLIRLENGGLTSVETFNFDKQLFQILQDPGKLIGKIQDHFMGNYFRKLKDKYFQDRIDMQNRNNIISINSISELVLNINLVGPQLEMYKNEDNTDIILYIGNNRNINHLVAIKLILSETIVHFEKDIRKLFSIKDDCIKLSFTCSNDILFDANGDHLHDKFSFVFYSHFNKAKINIDPRNLKEGLNQKLKTIQDMPFDLLYLHAAYFIHIKMDSNNINENFIKAKDDLLEIFESLDKILRGIWDKLKEKENYTYTEKDKKEIANLVLEYFDDININKEEKEEYIEQFKDIQFENTFIGFKKCIESAVNPGELLKKIVPYLYEIKKRKFRISSLSDDLFNRIYDLSLREKLNKFALNLGFAIVSVGAVGAAVTGVAAVRVLGAGVVGTVTGTAAVVGGAAGAAVVGGAAAVVGGAAGAIGAGAVAAAGGAAGRAVAVTATGAALAAAVVVAAAAAASVVAAGAAAGAAGAGVAAAAEAGVAAARAGSAAGATAGLVVAENYKKTIENQYKFDINWGENKVYKEIAVSMSKNRITNYIGKNTLGDFEKEFIENLKTWTGERDDDIFSIIHLNSQMRDILCKNHIIGSIGNKKSGKSTFVKLISNQNVPISAMAATTFATAYSICENNNLIYNNTIIIDYPHFNNSNLNQKLEFYFTRLLLSHIYLILLAINHGETIEEKKLYELVTSGKFFGITFICNQSDALYRDSKNIRDRLVVFKNSFRSNLAARINEEILYTCLQNPLLTSEYLKSIMRDDGILLEEGLKNKIFELIKRHFKE